MSVLLSPGSASLRGSARITTVVGILVVSAAVPPSPRPAIAASAQSRSGFHVREAFSDREDGWNDHGAEIWFAAGAFRIDLWNHGEEEATRVSWVIPPGNRTRAIWIFHPTRDFDECAFESFAMEEGGGPASWPIPATVDPISVQRADDPRQVGAWSTSAVDLRDPGPDEEWVPHPSDPRMRIRRTFHRGIGRLWFSDETGVNLGEVRAALAAALRPYQTAGGSLFVIHSMWALTILALDHDRVPGLPDGIPVALELEARGQLTATSELRVIERASLPATLFEVPAGYTRAARCPNQ